MRRLCHSRTALRARVRRRHLVRTRLQGCQQVNQRLPVKPRPYHYASIARQTQLDPVGLHDRGRRQLHLGERHPAPYPVEQVYDDFGRRTQMKTFRGGSGWDQSTWPASPGTADVTTWVYEDATGLLLEKRYADYGTTGNKIAYTYTAEGKLAS
ncbi:MAG TPA: hypothetical protein PLL65_12730, partial [Phycisphaerae bacterium]|nr:hypothetical protein [Phycisphaerae bacterium]